MKIIAPSIVLLLAGSAPAQTLWQVEGAGAIEEAVHILPSEFAEKQVLKMCEDFLAAHRVYTVLRFFVVTDETDAWDRLQGPRITDIEPEGWLRFYRLEPRDPPATAELLRINDRAAVRFRFRGGRIALKVLGSDDPFQITFKGERVKLLDISLMRENVPGGRIANGVHFYAQTIGAWNIDRARAFNDFLLQTTGLRRLSVSIEDGPWFAGEQSYPIFNRFLPSSDAPSLEELKMETRFYCENQYGGCVQLGPARRPR